MRNYERVGSASTAIRAKQIAGFLAWIIGRDVGVFR
jgi:hypothetical protein